VLEVRDLIVITDYFVIASGTSDRQVRTIADEVERVLAERGSKAIRREGRSDGRWILLDFGDLVVHVFATEEREYYELERLWADAPRLRWQQRTRTPKSGSSAR
jgi:ribosome-associated protein